MKKIILIASVLLILALLISCDMMDNGDQEMVDDGTQASVKMTALIKNIGNGIEVEVIEGDYEASGVYYVHISSDTIIVDANNQNISLSGLNVGDVVEIFYGGQVALSYPPQITANKIQVK